MFNLPVSSRSLQVPLVSDLFSIDDKRDDMGCKTPVLSISDSEWVAFSGRCYQNQCEVLTEHAAIRSGFVLPSKFWCFS